MKKTLTESMRETINLLDEKVDRRLKKAGWKGPYGLRVADGYRLIYTNDSRSINSLIKFGELDDRNRVQFKLELDKNDKLSQLPPLKITRGQIINAKTTLDSHEYSSFDDTYDELLKDLLGIQ